MAYLIYDILGLPILGFLIVFIIVLLPILWIIRTFKFILFWVYLWQLKEYHIGRFKAHFQTEKGKNLLFNKLNFLKVFLLFLFLGFYLSKNSNYVSLYEDYLIQFLIVITSLLSLIYFLEGFKFLRDLSQKKIKKPVFTKKTIFLVFILFFISILFLVSLYLTEKIIPLFLLIFDILTPVIVSLIVLLFQPLTVLLRNKILEKARKKRESFNNLTVIGITGSYGKTSTKEFLYTILSQRFKVLKTKEHQNSEIGISQCILNDLNSEHQIFICEMGAYNRGGIKLLCSIAKPKLGIITGINEQHMATFGSQENIIKTKYELIESLPQNGIAFFNAKNKYCQELYEKTAISKKLYAQEQEKAEQENLAGAVAVAKELGMTDEEVNRAKNKIKLWPQVEKIKGLNIINSTYSSNPHSVISHLNYINEWQGRRIIIMPCLIELGPAFQEVHQRIGEKINEVCDLAIITTKECFSTVEKSCIRKKNQVFFLQRPEEIFNKVKEFNQQDDVILLEGRLSKEIINFFYVDN